MPQADNALAGRWTNQEHEKFLLGIQLYGKNWKKIQEMISTRNCSQIRSHAQKYFLKLKKEKSVKFQSHHEQSSHNDSLNPHQNSTGHVKIQEPNSYSYFMNKIVEFTRSHQHMDIWDALIDSGSRKETVTNVSCQRIQDKKQNSEIQKIYSLRKVKESRIL